MSSDGVGRFINFNFDTSQLTRHIIVFAIILALAAISTVAMTAAVAINDKKLDRLADEGNKKAKRLKKLLEKPADFTESLNIAFYLILAFGVSYAAINIFRAFSGELYLRIASYAVSLIVCTFLIVLIGYFVPEKVAARYAEKIALRMYPALFVCICIIKPFMWSLRALGRVIAKIFGVDINSDDAQVTEEEIRLMVDVGEEKGVIPENEKMMINNIFEFNDTPVEKIMTHRVDVVAIAKETNFSEILKLVAKQGYTRIPVYDGTLDNITGILHTKSLISYVANDFEKEFTLDDYIIKAYFVPESKTADELFAEMQKGKMHMAVVVDEYGGTAGIVTMEDLIESILGNIQDEYDEEEIDVTCISENTYIFSGSTELDLVCETLGFEIEEDGGEEKFESNTLGGFVTELLEKIPQTGDSAEFENILFEVIEADGKKINRVKAIVKKQKPDESV